MSSPPQKTRSLLTRANKLERLYDSYSSNEGIHHLKYGQVLVPGMGNTRPKIVFIGDVPGDAEARTGVPLVGRRLNIVNELLRGVDLKPEHIFVTHLVKYRTPRGRDPRLSEATASLPTLTEEIRILQPCVVVTWGRFLLNMLAPGVRMEHAHGQHLPGDVGFMFVPMFSPEAAIVNPHVFRLLRDDFQKIRTLL